MAVTSHRYYFGVGLSNAGFCEMAQALANGAAQANAAWMRGNRWAPRLDALRPRYVDPPAAGGDPSCQGIQLAPALLSTRRGTCIDFAVYHAGWICAFRGLDALVEIVKREGSLHAVVRTDGDLFDVTDWVSRETGGLAR